MTTTPATAYPCPCCHTRPATMVLVDPTDASGPAGAVSCVECTAASCAGWYPITPDPDDVPAGLAAGARVAAARAAAAPIVDAYAAGVAAATAAAGWIADGNTDPAAAARVAAMMDDGDPAADAFMPTRPTLSGEWANDPTPLSVARDVTGDDDPDPDTIDAVADAWDAGVADTFGDVCRAELARWIG